MAGRPCTVCTSKDRFEMERRAARGEPCGAIVTDYDVAERALQRHMAKHAVKTMNLAAQAVGGRDLASGLGLNEEARELYVETREILAETRVAKDLPTALAGIGRALDCLSLLGKLTGKLGPDATVNVVQAVKVTLTLAGQGQGRAGDDDAS
jgi:hypothetical protein